MNKLIFPLVGALMLGATLPVLAGPDFQAIERARKAKQETQAARTGDAPVTVAAGPKNCPPQRLVLLLDHGPRAQGTPYLNRLRKERFEAEMKVCKDITK